MATTETRSYVRINIGSDTTDDKKGLYIGNDDENGRIEMTYYKGGGGIDQGSYIKNTIGDVNFINKDAEGEFICPHQKL